MLVSDSAANGVWVLIGSGSGEFLDATMSPVGVAPIFVEVADFNEDGAADVVTANNNAKSVSVLLSSSP